MSDRRKKSGFRKALQKSSTREERLELHRIKANEAKTVLLSHRERKPGLHEKIAVRRAA